MQHVRLGRTGLRVSRLCLGAMTFGYQVNEPASFAILDKAFGGGGGVSAAHSPADIDRALEAWGASLQDLRGERAP